MNNKILISLLSILLCISLSPQFTNVTGISEPEIDLANDLLESEETGPYWEKLNLTNSPSLRRLSPLVYDSENKKTILFSGYGPNGINPIADTWVFDSNTMKWNNVTPTNSPSARYGHRMVFDTITNKIILFGGAGTSGNLADTWTYDYVTNNWTEVTPTNSPSARRYHTMVYDNTNNIVLMHGGYQNLADTWSYNTTSNEWINMNITGGPGVRDGAYYSFDQDNGKFIVFGSYTGDSDTWAYDYKSNTWSDLDPTNEPAKRRSYGSNMFYNPIMKQSIFYGGVSQDFYTPLDDIWSFDYNNNSWYQINSTNTPGGKWSQGMAYDSDLHFTILFGGNNNMDETWILYLQQSNIRVENLPSNVNFNLGSDYKIVFNITTINATTYDILLNNEYISSYQYLDNDTISLDLNFIYSNFTYSNYTIFNNTKFEYTNLMLTFYNAQNNTYTHTLQIKVFDNLPIVIGSTSLNIDYEIGTSLPLEFQVNDDNPDMVYVYTGNTLLYANEWSNNINLNVNNFINSSNKLGGNYYKVIFEDMDHNQVEYNLNINVLDTINPVFTSVFADNYVEGDDFGVISFSVVDVTLDRYAVFANDIELANSTFGDTSYIEISNSGLLTGNYDVEIIVYDRSNNIAKISTSFFVESQGVNSTETSEISIENNNTITITETVQGNNSQNISIPEGTPIADLPFMLLVSFVGLYVFRKNRK